MTKEIALKLGFKEIGHFTVTDALIYDLGRARNLSLSCVGTPNEMLYICEKEQEDKYSDVICLHNWDYDKELTEEKLTTLLKWFNP